jgi:hypothetical protein
MLSFCCQFAQAPARPRAKSRGGNTLLRAATLGISLLLLAGRCLATGNSIEYQVKTGFLFNFAKFVEWPDSAGNPNKPLRLGVVASDDIYDLMASALSGKVANRRPIKVENVTADELEGTAALPDMIFVQQDIVTSRQDFGFTLAQLFTAAAKHPVLLVGESADFATSGGMIGFVQRGENLRFQVNLADARRAGLKLSARLSGLAEIVTDRP